MLAVTQVKFAWVDDLPFLIWQARCRSSARVFLEKFDSPQQKHHRVSLCFGTGELRLDMEYWAGGGALSPKLHLELLSYQWCKLDDTWAESSHRDVSCDSGRRTCSSQAWVSFTLRLQQNLRLWSSLDARMRARMRIMLYRWRAIGQVMPRRALALIPCKHKPKAVLQFVYRPGRHALEEAHTGKFSATCTLNSPLRASCILAEGLPLSTDLG